MYLSVSMTSKSLTMLGCLTTWIETQDDQQTQRRVRQSASHLEDINFPLDLAHPDLGVEVPPLDELDRDLLPKLRVHSKLDLAKLALAERLEQDVRPEVEECPPGMLPHVGGDCWVDRDRVRPRWGGIELGRRIVRGPLAGGDGSRRLWVVGLLLMLRVLVMRVLLLLLVLGRGRVLLARRRRRRGGGRLLVRRRPVAGCRRHRRGDQGSGRPRWRHRRRGVSGGRVCHCRVWLGGRTGVEGDARHGLWERRRGKGDHERGRLL